VKPKINILIITVCLFMVGCRPTAVFDQPQPSETDNMEQFPKRLQSQYVSQNGVAIITISNKMITKTYEYLFKVNVNQLDSAYKLVGDTLISNDTREKEQVSRVGDTLVKSVYEIDTVFLISENNVLKKYKGYYFLNFLREKSNWEVKKLEIAHGILSISEIAGKNDFDALREITETNDTTSYLFNPTKKQFKSFINLGGFSNKETYLRLKSSK
jgi:hypothetical protein